MNTKSLFKTTSLILALCFSICANAQVFTDSLILDLPMNGDAIDQSGNGNNGIVFNAVPDTNRTGVPNGAYKFNGTDSYIEIPASASMNKIQTANEITITTWINIRQWYDNWNVFAILERYNPSTDAGWGFEANWAAGGMLFLADETNVNNRADCSFSWNFNQWYHVAFTYSQADSIARFYVDGANVCSVPYIANINIADTTASFAIGRSLAGPNEYSDGWIDDFKVYYRVLTSNEIDTVFTTGIEKHLEKDFAIYPNPAKETITISNYPFGASIAISDMAGKQLFSTTAKAEKLIINTSDLANGLYIIRVENNGAYKTQKLVVSR